MPGHDHGFGHSMGMRSRVVIAEGHFSSGQIGIEACPELVEGGKPSVHASNLESLEDFQSVFYDMIQKGARLCLSCL
jgi:hypothetical protein